MWRAGFGLWRAALAFHLRHALALLPIAPLLCLPVYTDVLHTVLIKQWREGGLRPRTAALEALRALPMIVWLKWGSELRALLWSLVPLVFLMRVIEQRLCWGLASNVVVFEGRRYHNADERCMTLARTGYDLGLRALFALPVLFFTISAIAANLAGEATHSRWVFWLWMAVLFWLAFPGAAAANTFYYLRLAEQEAAAEAPAAPAPPLF